MFDFIRKPLIWEAWDEGLDRVIVKTGDFELKAMQDLAVYHHLRDATGKDIAEIGAGYSRVLPALAKANRCVSVEKFEGEGGGPKSEKQQPNIRNVSAYLGENDPALATGAYDIVFSVSVVEHVRTADDLDAFHADQLRILKPGGMFLHAIDIYLEDEPAAHHLKRFEAYRAWVTSTEGVAPTGPVYRGPCLFTCDIATNPDKMMYQWGKSSPSLIGLRQAAQSVSLLVGGRKLGGGIGGTDPGVRS